MAIPLFLCLPAKCHFLRSFLTSFMHIATSGPKLWLKSTYVKIAHNKFSELWGKLFRCRILGLFHWAVSSSWKYKPAVQGRSYGKSAGLVTLVIRWQPAYIDQKLIWPSSHAILGVPAGSWNWLPLVLYYQLHDWLASRRLRVLHHAWNNSRRATNCSHTESRVQHCMAFLQR